MRCSYCLLEAEFKCGCQQPYMCGGHLGTHMKTLGKHKFEVLEIELEQPRLQKLNSETLKRIKNINEAEKMISCTTESLIKTIEKVHKEFIGRLDSLRKKYFEILEQKKFFNSELPIIEKIETLELEVKIIQIINQIWEAYEGEFVNYFEKRKI